jgi:Sulfotransferase family
VAVVNPYVFIVGCPRSGTTLLGRIGDAHPQLAVIHETRWIAGFHKRRLGLTPEGEVTPELVERLREHKRFATLGLAPELLDGLLPGDRPVHYADFVASLFDLYGERRGKRLVGDKTPRYVRNLPTLHELWPHAKFVHLIRDGRDVCLSVLDWKKGAPKFPTWDEDPVSTTALWWEWNVKLGREAGALLGPERYHELRYEALVAEPEGECRALCAFLGLPYDASMLRFHEGRMLEDARLDAKKAWRPVTAGLRSWRTDMPPDDVLRFEAAAGPLLEELGYERAGSAPMHEYLARARRHRAAFERHLRQRGSAVPERWESQVA